MEGSEADSWSVKRCSKCGHTKALTDFRKHRGFPDGHMSQCKACKDELDRIRKYGVNSTEYNARLKNQAGVCAICGQRCMSGRRLGIDHDHQTGKVRGLLCRKCNQVLGLMNDSIERLFKAINYLNENTSNGNSI